MSARTSAALLKRPGVKSLWFAMRACASALMAWPSAWLIFLALHQRRHRHVHADAEAAQINRIADLHRFRNPDRGEVVGFQGLVDPGLARNCVAFVLCHRHEPKGEDFLALVEYQQAQALSVEFLDYLKIVNGVGRARPAPRLIDKAR
ncbi:MAG: hypothetical protein QUV35_17785 [Hydrogenophaga sp.]|uniref:hypothetical protein n=1 Tax=Hydrogenophaga sp. TaxID=1904254 RepID=UPI002616967A|nr:hypothetical protein [Hydrogenophaga sp.]MDM7944477.1 hypothetical protein [Hydrogenophaga sp.]